MTVAVIPGVGGFEPRLGPLAPEGSLVQCPEKAFKREWTLPLASGRRAETAVMLPIRPGTLNGEPVPVIVRIDMTFKLK